MNQKTLFLFPLAVFSALMLNACGTETSPNTGVTSTTNGLKVNVLAAMSGPPSTLKRLGALEVTIPMSSTIDAATAKQIVTSDVVTLEFSNGETFAYQNIDGMAVVDGDVIYAESKNMPSLMTGYQTHVAQPLPNGTVSPQSSIGRRGYICTFRLMFCWAGFTNQPSWPNKTIYFQYDLGLNSNEIATLLRARDKWNTAVGASGVQWVNSWNPNGPTTIFIKLPRTSLIPFSGLSPIGYTQQRQLPRIFIKEGFFNNNTLTHEMGHAAGLNHEHQRCDRDQFLNINVSFFERYVNFFNWSPICAWGEDIGKFNYDSVMMYRPLEVQPKAGAVNYRGNPAMFRDNVNINTEKGLDAGDIADGLKALYP